MKASTRHLTELAVMVAVVATMSTMVGERQAFHHEAPLAPVASEVAAEAPEVGPLEPQISRPIYRGGVVDCRDAFSPAARPALYRLPGHRWAHKISDRFDPFRHRVAGETHRVRALTAISTAPEMVHFRG